MIVYIVYVYNLCTDPLLVVLCTMFFVIFMNWVHLRNVWVQTVQTDKRVRKCMCLESNFIVVASHNAYTFNCLFWYISIMLPV